jgi:hypothetical protein
MDGDELEGVLGATESTGTGDDGAAAAVPQGAIVTDGQLLVRMFLTRPHSLWSMDSFHLDFTATQLVT